TYENRIANLERRVEDIERQQTELKQFERTLLKRDFLMTTIQIIAMVLAIFGAGGYLAYQNSKSLEQIDKRFDQMEKRYDSMEKRFELMERRYDDLKQVVLSDRQNRERNSSGKK